MSDMIQKEIQSILLDEATLHKRVKELGLCLSNDLAGKDVMLIGVLKGSFCFFADLVRAMEIPVTIDFIACSSYGNSSESGGKLSITKDISGEACGKELVIVEDIIDTGLTLHELTQYLQTKQPSGLHTVALLDKPSRRKTAIVADYIGFTIPDEFVVGYGLDYAERFRQLPYIGILKPEVYHKNFGCQKQDELL